MRNREAIKECVNVEFKFWFMQKKSYYLILLVLRWIILYLILENDLLFSRNQVFCFKKWKLVEALIQVEFIIFLWNFAHVFSSQCLQNYFLLCFAVLTKNQKTFFFWIT